MVKQREYRTYIKYPLLYAARIESCAKSSGSIVNKYTELGLRESCISFSSNILRKAFEVWLKKLYGKHVIINKR